jgi:predicted RNase H-like HicB family nuclease
VKNLKKRTWGDVARMTAYARTLFPDDPAKVDHSFYLVGRWLQGKELNTDTLLETLEKFEEFYRITGLSIVLFKNAEGYTAECPLLPGCITQGESEDEVLTNLAEAIAIYRKVRDQIGRH